MYVICAVTTKPLKCDNYCIMENALHISKSYSKRFLFEIFWFAYMFTFVVVLCRHTMHCIYVHVAHVVY